MYVIDALSLMIKTSQLIMNTSQKQKRRKEGRDGNKNEIEGLRGRLSKNKRKKKGAESRK